ncbi:nose resistant to fluoxetine protein 6-like [Drosophila eugracilis]|uniref:nose resistant to fluoxetine protein 6-like n=1 Tax=Drosophila eugracilis TaxID=29029 RepID=UPI001BDB0C8B|nr:nose resistant to fluoxetine protein 6-like [Drosophila eugracilis]
MAEYHRLTRLRHLSEEFFSYYQNVTISDLVPETRLPTTQDLQCYAEFAQLASGLSSGSLWAYKMVDAWGSIPSGILMGHLKDLGHYDECVRIDQAIGSNGHVLGKYCRAQLPLQQLLGSSTAISLLSPQTAVCFPASCSAANMDTLLRRVIQQLLSVQLNSDLTFVKESTCKTAERESYDGWTIFTIVLLSIFGAAVAIATLYDYFLCEDQKKLPPLLKAFSARANSRALFHVSTKSNPNVIECLNGIRCMSLIWVCYGHDYIVTFTSPNINYVDIYAWAKTPFMEFINEGVFAVDTFFFLSGLLVAVVSLRAMERAKGKLNIPLMYLHRYLRITPMLAVAIIVHLKILPLMGDGPLYGQWNFDNYDNCKKSWFWTLLYVQNYATENECLIQAWYLAIDMQLYILAPIFLFAVVKWGKKGAAAILVLILVLAGFLIGYVAINEYSLISLNAVSSQGVSHHTHNRASGWLMGFLFGYFLHTIRGKKIKLSRPAVWAGWIISLAIFFTIIFAMYPYGIAKSKSLSAVAEAFYISLSRIAWPLALSWVVFACMQGYGGLANAFLSSPLWQPLSKLSFSTYIWHLFIQNLNAGRTRVNTYFSDYDVMLRFWQDFGFSVLLAFVMYILIEAPCGGIETLLLPNRRPTPQPSQHIPEAAPKAVETSKDPEKQSGTLDADSVAREIKIFSGQA